MSYKSELFYVHQLDTYGMLLIILLSSMYRLGENALRNCQ